MGRKRHHDSLVKLTKEVYNAHLPHLFYHDVIRTPYMEGLYDFCIENNAYIDETMLLYIADHQSEFLPHLQDKKTGLMKLPYSFEHLLKTVRHHMLSEEELDQIYDEKNIEKQQTEGQKRTEAEINHYINLAPHTTVNE